MTFYARLNTEGYRALFDNVEVISSVNDYSFALAFEMLCAGMNFFIAISLCHVAT